MRSVSPPGASITAQAESAAPRHQAVTTARDRGGTPGSATAPRPYRAVVSPIVTIAESGSAANRTVSPDSANAWRLSTTTSYSTTGGVGGGAGAATNAVESSSPMRAMSPRNAASAAGATIESRSRSIWTRRLSARPSAVRFGATGRSGP